MSDRPEKSDDTETTAGHRLYLHLVETVSEIAKRETMSPIEVIGIISLLHSSMTKIYVEIATLKNFPVDKPPPPV